MASAAEVRRSPFQLDHHAQGLHKSIPILPSSTASSTLTPPRDPMDITPSTLPTMGPPVLSSPVGERNGTSQQTNGESEAGSATNGTSAAGSAPAIGAAAAAQQPKVVQTAFIHKLYKWVCPFAVQRRAPANATTVCSKTKASSISSHGRARTRVLSCPLQANFPKSCRT